jgi:hypothetical protein
MQWQYKLVDYNISGLGRDAIENTENQMNGSGGEGWEAVSVWKDGQKIFVLYKKPWKTS